MEEDSKLFFTFTLWYLCIAVGYYKGWFPGLENPYRKRFSPQHSLTKQSQHTTNAKLEENRSKSSHKKQLSNHQNDSFNWQPSNIEPNEEQIKALLEKISSIAPANQDTFPWPFLELPLSASLCQQLQTTSKLNKKTSKPENEPPKEAKAEKLLKTPPMQNLSTKLLKQMRPLGWMYCVPLTLTPVVKRSPSIISTQTELPILQEPLSDILDQSKKPSKVSSRKERSSTLAEKMPKNALNRRWTKWATSKLSPQKQYPEIALKTKHAPSHTSLEKQPSKASTEQDQSRGWLYWSSAGTQLKTELSKPSLEQNEQNWLCWPASTSRSSAPWSLLQEPFHETRSESKGELLDIAYRRPSKSSLKKTEYWNWLRRSKTTTKKEKASQKESKAQSFVMIQESLPETRSTVKLDPSKISLKKNSLKKKRCKDWLNWSPSKTTSKRLSKASLRKENSQAWSSWISSTTFDSSKMSIPLPLEMEVKASLKAANKTESKQSLSKIKSKVWLDWLSTSARPSASLTPPEETRPSLQTGSTIIPPKKTTFQKEYALSSPNDIPTIAALKKSQGRSSWISSKTQQGPYPEKEVSKTMQQQDNTEPNLTKNESKSQEWLCWISSPAIPLFSLPEKPLPETCASKPPPKSKTSTKSRDYLLNRTDFDLSLPSRELGKTSTNLAKTQKKSQSWFRWSSSDLPPKTLTIDSLPQGPLPDIECEIGGNSSNTALKSKSRASPKQKNVQRWLHRSSSKIQPKTSSTIHLSESIPLTPQESSTASQSGGLWSRSFSKALSESSPYESKSQGWLESLRWAFRLSATSPAPTPSISSRLSLLPSSMSEPNIKLKGGSSRKLFSTWWRKHDCH